MHNKKIFNLLLIPALLVMLTGCKKWLDVKPNDRFTELQAFENETGVQTVLNGIYLNLATRNLYGDNLTMGTVEILAQRYNIGTQHSKRTTWAYTYTDAAVQTVLDNIWTDAYVNIVNINVFLENLNKYNGNWPSRSDSIFRGEAHALRAMMHFDLLRLWGPMYNTADSVATSIPYYTKATKDIMELLPANEVMNMVGADLDSAISYLQGDPVRVSGANKATLGDGLDFYRNRHQRMNYFAANALKARYLLYRNNKADAYEVAKQTITDVNKFFAWVVPSSVLSNNDNPDRTFSTELLFGLYSPTMYNAYRALFVPTLSDGTILAPSDTRLKAVYETNENDYRFNPSWQLSNVSSKTYKTFYKYADVVDSKKEFRFLVPMFRKSELYYIAAECATDTDEKLSYLNTVRYNRGLTDLVSTANITTELAKEYAKEFYGEGQLWYYYKRTNTTRILNATTTTSTSYVTVNANHYVFPLPLSETSFR